MAGFEDGLPGQDGGMHAAQHGSEQDGGGMVNRVKQQVRDLGERVAERASDTATTGKNRVADRIHDLGDAIEDRARPLEEQGGVRGRAGHAAHRVGDALEDSAEYLRSHDFGSILDDVQSTIRRHPLAAVGLALGAGYLLAGVMGSSEEDEHEEEQWHDRDERHQRSRARRAAPLLEPLGRLAMTALTAAVSQQVRKRVGGTT
jgi:hypothetical protein